MLKCNRIKVKIKIFNIVYRKLVLILMENILHFVKAIYIQILKIISYKILKNIYIFINLMINDDVYNNLYIINFFLPIII